MIGVLVRILVVNVVAVAGIVAMATDVMGQQVGKLTVECATPQLDSLLRINVRTNYNQSTIDGYRIQIYSGSGIQARKEAEQTRTRFLELFPTQKVVVVYNAPFWKVRVGDYRFRSEALHLLEKVKICFPGSYAVRDNTIPKKVFVK